MIMKTIEFLWCYWNMCWLLTRLRQEGSHTRVRDVVRPQMNFEHWTMDIEFVNRPTGGRLRERKTTWDNVWEPCVQGDRSHQKPHARRVFGLHNMHTPLDFNSVDFLGMMEVLSLQLIFMHRGNWRDFLWSYYCAFDIVPLCLDNTVTVGHIDCMMCWFYVYCCVGYGPCILRDTPRWMPFHFRNAIWFPPA